MKPVLIYVFKTSTELLDQQDDGTEMVFPVSLATRNISVHKETLRRFSSTCLSSFMSYKPVHKGNSLFLISVCVAVMLLLHILKVILKIMLI